MERPFTVAKKKEHEQHGETCIANSKHVFQRICNMPHVQVSTEKESSRLMPQEGASTDSNVCAVLALSTVDSPSNAPNLLPRSSSYFAFSDM